MIGEIRTVLTPFYDARTSSMSIKSRPGLIIAKADSQDYVLLPVSTITRQWNVDPVYDIEVDPSVYPLLGLNKRSYIRTHKQTVVHGAEIGKFIGDLKGTYSELYLEVLTKREQFSAEITKQAL